MNASKTIAWCCVIVMAALFVVGAVSHGLLRHAVQSVPLWFALVAGFRGRETAKWAALPCFVFWFGIMTLIWLYLAGLVHFFNGYFSATEIAMSIVVGATCGAGLVACFLWPTRVRAGRAIGITAALTILQLLIFRISLLPYISNH